MIYLIQTDTPPIELPEEVTVTGKLAGVQTEKQLDMLLENALLFDEAVSRGLLDEETVKQLKESDGN